MEELELKFNWRKLLNNNEYKLKLIDFICELGDAGFFENYKIKYPKHESEAVKRIIDRYNFDNDEIKLIKC